MLITADAACILALMAGHLRAVSLRSSYAMSADTGAGLVFSRMSTALTNSLTTLTSGLLVSLAAAVAFLLWTVFTVLRGARSARALVNVSSGLLLVLSLGCWSFAEPVSALVAGLTALAPVLAENSVSARRYFGAS